MINGDSNAIEAKALYSNGSKNIAGVYLMKAVQVF